MNLEGGAWHAVLERSTSTVGRSTAERLKFGPYLVHKIGGAG
jgi:hypothetical protein